MNNNLLNYFSEINEVSLVVAMISFDKLGLFNPLTMRIERQENI